MNDIFVSPPVNDHHLLTHEDDDIADEENLIKIRLFFFSEDKKLHAKVFPEEWYTVMADEYGEDYVSKEFQPWLEVSLLRGALTLSFSLQFHVHDFATFEEMLMTGLAETNKRFEIM